MLHHRLIAVNLALSPMLDWMISSNISTIAEYLTETSGPARIDISGAAAYRSIIFHAGGSVTVSSAFMVMVIARLCKAKKMLKKYDRFEVVFDQPIMLDAICSEAP